MWARAFLIFALLSVAFGFSTRDVHAAESSTPANQIVFYLDWGFVGRPVSLDAFGGKARVSWDAGDLTAPTMLMLELEKEGSDDVVHLTWADPYHLASRGVRVELPQSCAPDAMTDCALHIQNGSSWTKAANGRAYGHARVKIAKTASPYMKSGAASWYKYKNCRCAASPDFPKGTRVKVTSQLTGKSIVVRINDWGPERDKHPERVIDLDLLAFQEFAPKGAGLIRVSVEPLSPDHPEYALADIPYPAATVAATTKPAEPVVKPEPAPAWSY